MKIIVAGCGRFGAMLSGLLHSDGHKVTVIDEDINSFKKLQQPFAGKTVGGIAFDKDVLQDAGVELADALAAVTGVDNVNIVTALIARKRFKVPVVLARIDDQVKAEIYRRMDIATMSPTLCGVNRMNEILCHPDLLRISTFGNGEVEIIEVEASILLEGRYVEAVTIPSELTVVSIVRSGAALLPAMGTPFLKGDKIFFAATLFGKTKMKQLMGI